MDVLGRALRSMDREPKLTAAVIAAMTAYANAGLESIPVPELLVPSSQTETMAIIEKPTPVRQVVRPRQADITVAIVKVRPSSSTAESACQLQSRTSAVVKGIT